MSGNRLPPLLRGEDAERWVRSRPGGSAGGPERGRVERIMDRVRSEGDRALLEYGERFDGVRPASVRVPPRACGEALDSLDRGRRQALERARRNVEQFHRSQRRSEERVETAPGVRAWREFRPIERVGLYVPGGRAPYPSSLLMTAVPARVAGCDQVVACSPPAADGRPARAVMAAAALLGVDELYAAGGAQAIAAMAYGTETVQRADKLFGPGGPWVDAAKTAAYRDVEVDLPAGPSEVLVWADEAASPDLAAAELLAQAEHGPDSLAAAVVPSPDAGRALLRSLEERLPGLPRREAAAASLSSSAVLVAASEGQAEAWVNGIAPEHLVLLREDAGEASSRVRSAGSVLLGPWSPVAAGDYAAGPNHVLPTGRRARAAGGLGLDDFGRWVQFQELTREGLEALSPAVTELAEWEGFRAHADSVRLRLDPEEERR